MLQNTSQDLKDNPGVTPNQATSLLYAGEMFDFDNQHYYNRARWYNPYNGLFNRTDPYAGNTQDPQSLHKFLYCHANPINGIDPSGQFSILSLTMSLATIASIASIFVPRAIGLYRSSKQLLDLADFAQLLRRLADKGIIDMMLAEQMRIEVSKTAINLIGVIGGQILDIVKEAVSYYAYGLLFAAVTGAAMGGLKASVKLAKASRVTTKVADEVIDQHHLVFRAAVKRKYLKVNNFSIPNSLHHTKGTGLHSKIANSRFRHIQPVGRRTMRSIFERMNRQQWLDELGECYKWLETEFRGDYDGIYEAYQKAVKGIGGVSGLI